MLGADAAEDPHTFMNNAVIIPPSARPRVVPGALKEFTRLSWEHSRPRAVARAGIDRASGRGIMGNVISRVRAASRHQAARMGIPHGRGP